MHVGGPAPAEVDAPAQRGGEPHWIDLVTEAPGVTGADRAPQIEVAGAHLTVPVPCSRVVERAGHAGVVQERVRVRGERRAGADDRDPHALWPI